MRAPFDGPRRVRLQARAARGNVQSAGGACAAAVHQLARPSERCLWQQTGSSWRRPARAGHAVPPRRACPTVRVASATRPPPRSKSTSTVPPATMNSSRAGSPTRNSAVSGGSATCAGVGLGQQRRVRRRRRLRGDRVRGTAPCPAAAPPARRPGGCRRRRGHACGSACAPCRPQCLARCSLHSCPAADDGWRNVCARMGRWTSAALVWYWDCIVFRYGLSATQQRRAPARAAPSHPARRGAGQGGRAGAAPPAGAPTASPGRARSSRRRWARAPAARGSCASPPPPGPGVHQACSGARGRIPPTPLMCLATSTWPALAPARTMPAKGRGGACTASGHCSAASTRPALGAPVWHNARRSRVHA